MRITNYSSKYSRSTLVVTIDDNRFDKVNSLEFKEYMIELISKHKNSFILDLSQIEFMDSSALGAVVSVLKHLQPAGDMCLVTNQQPVISLLNLTRMNKVFLIFDNIEAAENNFL